MSKKRITIILGAGASVEFHQPDKNGNLLATSSLTSLLRPDRVDDFIKSTDEALIKQNKNWALSSDIEAYKEYKKTFLKCVEYSMHYGFNFEETIHLIDTAIDVIRDHGQRYLDARLWGKESSSFHLVNLFKGRYFTNITPSLGNLPFDVRDYILQYILKYHKLSIMAVPVWHNFIKKLTKKYFISLYNLNYDDLMIEVAKSIAEKESLCLNTGFDLQKGQSHFNAMSFYNAQDILAQLHGNIHFVPEYNQEIYISYFNDILNADNKRLSFKRALYNQARARDYNLTMITGLTKFEHIAKEPYATYYRRLIRDLDNSKIVIIIGYGGADTHINMVLKSPLIKGKKILIVDNIDKILYGEDVCNKLGDKLLNFLPDDFCNKQSIIAKVVDLSIGENCKLYTYGTNKFIKTIADAI